MPADFDWMHLQESGLKVKEYELLRRNFSETGNFGEPSARTIVHC